MTVHNIFCSTRLQGQKNSSLNEQIRILEEYKEQEFTEKWSYELAALYYKAEKNRNVWIYAMKSFSGSVKANML